jgi:hypothetical protein
MKKLCLVLVVSFFVFQAADAQLFKYGLKAGIGFSNLKFSDVTGIEDGNDVYDLVTGDAVTGYHIGLQTRVKVAMLFVQPEFYFNAGGATVEQIHDNGATEAFNIRFSSLDLPVLLGFKLGPVRLMLGPTGSYVLKEDNGLTELDPDYSLLSSSFTWGWQGGIGVDLSRFTIDARYEGSLSKLGESMSIGGSEYALDARPNQILVSLGFWFK